jgi:O-antigen ligase
VNPRIATKLNVRPGALRARLIAAYLLCAGLLGGGGIYFPAQELLLELLFVGVVLVCLWSRRATGLPPGDTIPVYAIVGLVLSIPVLQLIPLPPSIWQAFPGREGSLAALRLVGSAETWRPVSLVPSKTLACLLSLVPPLGLFILTSQLGLEARRLVLYASAVLAFLSAAFGVAQLSAPDGSLTLYTPFYVGWITGFQVGRNSEADVLLVGFLAVGAIAKLALSGKIWHLPSSQPKGLIIGLTAFFGLLLAAAVVMTGSRTGAMHLLLAAAAWLMIFSVGRKGNVAMGKRLGLFVGVGAVLLAGLVYFLVSGEGSAINRVWQRFASLADNRSEVWQLGTAAWHTYWPVGAGRGAYIEAVLPLEPLETLSINWPNRAHNEYIEMGIEAGLAAYVVLAAVVACIAFMAVRKWVGEKSREARIQLIYAATVLVILAFHSLVDFPLRGMSLACIAGAACGLLTRAARGTERVDGARSGLRRSSRSDALRRESP